MQFKTQKELKSFLLSEGIDLSFWGKNEANSLEAFYLELQRGESQLEKKFDGLHRFCFGAQIIIRYRKGEEVLRLVEDKQVLLDGTIRRRVLISSIGEKLLRDEDAQEGAWRALKEELKIKERLPLKIEKPEIKNVLSKAYPGLFSDFHTHTFSTWLPERYFNPLGYKEVQKTKTNYWIWQKEAEGKD